MPLIFSIITFRSNRQSLDSWEEPSSRPSGLLKTIFLRCEPWSAKHGVSRPR
ncbi:hypothetical protein [Piscirickettsia salmonis]|uniref:hypothetical protein n=1 Tax=Piscirickettsia salmonis TaxID=1238 RepID=UPI0012B7747D|nr:hypothetical protein [Piscirickettsia salmonis]QHS27151.1 hypothetical protein GW538_16020 [Piscirickettsia salmonis]